MRPLTNEELLIDGGGIIDKLAKYKDEAVAFVSGFFEGVTNCGC